MLVAINFQFLFKQTFQCEGECILVCFSQAMITLYSEIY
jgi:hypothetical protein